MPLELDTVRQRRGRFRRMYSPVEEAEQGTAARANVVAAEEDEEEMGRKPKSRRTWGWLRRQVSREYALGRRWKLSGTVSRLAAGLRWKRVSSGLSVSLGGGGGECASAVLETVAFRVMYVVEAVVLGLALSCFYCCCGCQI